MVQTVQKIASRFKKLHETLEIAEKHEKVNTKKVKICDKLLEIYEDKEIDSSKKSELFIQVLETAHCEKTDE